MRDHPVLGQVALGYSPMIDRQRNVVATRLTVFPDRPDATPDAAALLAALEDVWPSANGADEPLKLAPRPLDPGAVVSRSAVRPPVSLNLAGEQLLRSMMAAGPGAHVMVEVPAFMAGSGEDAAALRQLHDGGAVMLIKGRPLSPLAPEVLAMFSHSIVEAGEDRRTATPPPPGVRSVTTVQAGARSSAEIEAAFERGAIAVLGWPWDDAPPKPLGRGNVPADVTTVMELIQGVDREDSVPKLEAVLRRDPTLAFRLMRYLNSPAFGLSVEINSFGHALQMLGYQRLKRWLALLLASSAKGVNAKPVIFAAVRRGLFLESLCPDPKDSQLRGEMFICGVFSLLDRLLNQPISDLLGSVPVPDGVRQALMGEGGPYLPYVELVRAIELESVFDIRERSEALMLSSAAVNRAVLDALRGGRQLEG